MNKMNKDLSMEDVHTILLAAFEKMRALGVDTDSPDADALWDRLSACLEESFGYPDYRNYN
jgi:lipoate-protein ligase A